MAIATIKAGARYYRVTPATASQTGAPFLELGPAGTSLSVSLMMIQFNGTQLFDGLFNVMGRIMGPAADAVDVPFIPIPYRRVTINNVAQDYAFSTVPISGGGATLIQVPANGMSIVLQMAAATLGTCDIVSWDLQGSSAI